MLESFVHVLLMFTHFVNGGFSVASRIPDPLRQEIDHWRAHVHGFNSFTRLVNNESGYRVHSKIQRVIRK